MRDYLGPGEDVASLDGITVRFNDWVTKAGKAEPNWTMKCKYHASCNKRRGAVAAHMARHGKVECLAFLHAWHEVKFPTHPKYTTHAQETPTPEAVDAVVAAHRDELLEICRKAGH